MQESFLFIDIDGVTINKEDRMLIQHPYVAGIILFEKNYESKDQIKSLIEELRLLKPNLIIAIDQEGGRVQRFKHEFSTIKPMYYFSQLARHNEADAHKVLSESVATLFTELDSIGINLNFYQVLDLYNEESRVIAERSFGQTPEEVCQYAKLAIQAQKKLGYCSVGKHFPGHGGVLEDSHLELPTDTRDLNTLENNDLLPFLHLLPSLDAIMTSHIVFNSIDSDLVTFSSFWLRDYLRVKHGYEGVIMSDCLSMHATYGYGAPVERATRALAAGCDMVIFCNQRQGVLDIINQNVEFSDEVGRTQRVTNFINEVTNHHYASSIP